jgi:hypothetical protein
MSAPPTTLEELIALCRNAPNKKERLKSVNKDTIGDILAAATPIEQALGQDLKDLMQQMLDEMAELPQSNEKFTAALDRMQQMESDILGLKKENAGLKEQLKKQGQVLRQQQMFLERIDTKERANNLIIVGVPEGVFLGSQNDTEKVHKVLEPLGEGLTTDNAITSVKRIGAPEAGKTRPILTIVKTNELRNKIVNAARSSTQELMKDIQVKKDMDPSVRAEWKRLFDSKKAEEEKPENANRRVVLDFKKRQVTCDGQIVDSWCNQLF